MMGKWVLAGLLVGLFFSSAPLSARTLRLGLTQSESFSRQEYAQILQMMKMTAEAYQKKFGVTVSINTFGSTALYTQAIKKKELDILFNHSEVALNMGFVPMLSIGLFNETAPRDCVMVHKNSPYKSVKDLKGKKFAIHTSSGSRFYRLARMTKTNPLSTYKLTGGANDPSLAYMVSIGDAEGTMAGVWSMGLMSMTNPGVVKSLRRLECTHSCPLFITISPSVSESEKKRFIAFLNNLQKEPLMVRLRPLMKSVGLFFRPYSLKEMRQCDARQLALTGGVFRYDWLEEYQLWSTLEVKKQKNRLP